MKIYLFFDPENYELLDYSQKESLYKECEELAFLYRAELIINTPSSFTTRKCRFTFIDTELPLNSKAFLFKEVFKNCYLNYPLYESTHIPCYLKHKEVNEYGVGYILETEDV